ARVVVAVVEAGDAQTLQAGDTGKRPNADARLDRLLVVRIGMVVAVAVVVADVDVAEVAGEVVVEGDPAVGRGHEALAVDEDGALEAIAVDALRVVDIGRLLDAEAEECALPHPLVEVDLSVGVLETEGVAAVEGAPHRRLPDDVRGDAEG